MHRTTEQQCIHDALVEKVVDLFKQRPGHYREVQAQLEGYRWPGKVKWKGEKVGMVPDAQALAGDRGVVVEVETGESIFEEHTATQWRLFSKFARVKHWTFWIIVPQGEQDRARLRAMELKLKRYKIYGIDPGLDAPDAPDSPAP